jgi:hypothetical protein
MGFQKTFFCTNVPVHYTFFNHFNCSYHLVWHFQSCHFFKLAYYPHIYILSGMGYHPTVFNACPGCRESSIHFLCQAQYLTDYYINFRNICTGSLPTFAFDRFYFLYGTGIPGRLFQVEKSLASRVIPRMGSKPAAILCFRP